MVKISEFKTKQEYIGLSYGHPTQCLFRQDPEERQNKERDEGHKEYDADEKQANGDLCNSIVDHKPSCWTQRLRGQGPCCLRFAVI